MRQVIDGERLSGHKDEASGRFPTIIISDLPHGTVTCAIESFHWAEVTVKGDTSPVTELQFENGTCITVSDGIVEYDEAAE